MKLNEIEKLFASVQEKKPLIHHITNAVTINDCANATLAIGGSPVMATAIEEVKEMVQLANALVINLGTLDELKFSSMLVAGMAANQKNIPVVLDPVGVGATTYRTEKAKILLDKIKVTVIRGNISEVHSLVGGNSKTKGVDAGDVSTSKSDLAQNAAKLFNCVVGISGKEDVISDGRDALVLQNGDELLTKVTGTGCMSSSLIGVFTAVTKDYFAAAVTGMSAMSIAGERARQLMVEDDGIGTFRVKLMDEIYKMNYTILEKEMRFNEIRLQSLSCDR